MVGRPEAEQPWGAYSLPTPEGDDDQVLDRYEFDAAWHVCHLDDAVRIVEDGLIRPRLVEDQSVLRTTRTAVTWLSANHWAIGYRYGNIRFDVPWQRLVEGNTLYWVEDVTHYRPPAYRLLIAADAGPVMRVPSVAGRATELMQYPSRDRGGPVWTDDATGRWYRNDQRCVSEFLLPRDVPLAWVTRVGFVNHNERYCSIHRNAPHECRHLGLHAMRVGARFVATLASRSEGSPHARMVAGLIDDTDLWNSWGIVVGRLGCSLTGFPWTEADPDLMALSRAILMAWGSENDTMADALMRREPDRLALSNAINWILYQTFPQAEAMCRFMFET